MVISIDRSLICGEVFKGWVRNLFDGMHLWSFAHLRNSCIEKNFEAAIVQIHNKDGSVESVESYIKASSHFSMAVWY